jgi:hypothetical protein
MASAAPAPAAPAVAAEISNFNNDNKLTPEARGRLWWQLEQMTCPVREADSHIPFVKSQLQLLYKTAVRTVESYRGKATEAQMATYQTHLDNIFRDRTVSFTSLNIKSLQCAMLFTILTIHIPNPDTNSYRRYIIDDIYFPLHAIKWDTYEPVLAFIKSKEMRYLDWLVIDETESPCIPDLKNKAIVVLLGEMTLYELISSMTNDIYFCGLITSIANIDGREGGTPLGFLDHDLGHMADRFLFSRPEQIHQTNENVKQFLHFLNNTSEHIRNTCLMWVFL